MDSFQKTSASFRIVMTEERHIRSIHTASITASPIEQSRSVRVILHNGHLPLCMVSHIDV